MKNDGDVELPDAVGHRHRIGRKRIGRRLARDVDVRVIGTLPQTGFNVGTLGGSTSFLKPVTASSTSSGGMPLAIWMALAAGGIGAGGIFGRRFFI